MFIWEIVLHHPLEVFCYTVCLWFSGLLQILNCILCLSYGKKSLDWSISCVWSEAGYHESISHTFIHLLCKSLGYGESYFYTKQPYFPVPQINTNVSHIFITVIGKPRFPAALCKSYIVCHGNSVIYWHLWNQCIPLYLIFSIFQLRCLLKHYNCYQLYSE